MTGTCLGLVAALFEPLAPAIALAALTKMPCRWHCERQRQDGDIHRLAAGNALHSLVSSLPTGFSCPIVSSRNVIEFFVSRLPKLFARLRSIEPRAPFPTLTRCLPHPLRPPRGRRPWTWPAANGGPSFGGGGGPVAQWPRPRCAG